jgi:hypothetical protein
VRLLRATGLPAQGANTRWLSSWYINLAVVALVYLIVDAEVHPLYDATITHIHFSHAKLDLSGAFRSVLYI